jgi:hypothetical protein
MSTKADDCESPQLFSVIDAENSAYGQGKDEDCYFLQSLLNSEQMWDR